LLAIVPYIDDELSPETGRAIVDVAVDVLHNSSAQAERIAAELLLRRSNRGDTIEELNRTFARPALEALTANTSSFMTACVAPDLDGSSLTPARLSSTRPSDGLILARAPHVDEADSRGHRWLQPAGLFPADHAVAA
jgi:hypothetical protein